MSRGDFAKSRQLLRPSEEEAVKDWLAHESGAARPVHPRNLCARVNEIGGNGLHNPPMYQYPHPHTFPGPQQYFTQY
ncbi:hypothetical protein BDR07DRAFT_1393153 [Suillus spraguei]|nr:hypothetical protein BDR07DRAFT_1393153 [Suillus spraguei]